MMTSGTLIATAGGPYVCIWDILGSGQMLRKLRNHQKTVTTISIANNVGSEADRGPRLLSGSLDSTIKVIDNPFVLLDFDVIIPDHINLETNRQALYGPNE